MIEVHAELDDDEVTGLSTGHLTFTSNSQIFSSKGKKPSQEMMIFLSVIEMLDGLRNFLFSDAEKYEFVGVDSSFTLGFEKVGVRNIRIFQKNKELDILNIDEFVFSVYSPVKIFLDEALEKMPSDDMAYEDIVGSLEGFRSILR